jgi:hypothetical protein
MEKRSQNFRLLANFELRPKDFEFEQDDTQNSTPLSIATKRFKRDYFYSEVKMEVDDHEDTLELAYDIAYAITQIPDWLIKLAAGDCRSTLIFGAQGSERELIVERQGDDVVYWFRPFFSGGGNSPRIRLPAVLFLNEWIRFTNQVLDQLAELHEQLPDDPEFQMLRKSLNDAQVAVMRIK